MTQVGSGGVVITQITVSARFEKDFKKLAPEFKQICSEKLKKLLDANPLPSGLRFEKLKGYSNPDIYTIHVTGNYKVSMEIKSGCATLRRVACHNEIDRTP